MVGTSNQSVPEMAIHWLGESENGGYQDSPILEDPIIGVPLSELTHHQ